jgi:hypothetical protein
MIPQIKNNFDSMKLAPICLFTYNRIEETQNTIRALKKNYLASESSLYIFSDGPKNEVDKGKVEKLRIFLQEIDGFKSIIIYESEHNKGLANSVIDGATRIIKKYGQIIALEDDLVTSPNFLNFMNQALNFYSNNKNIFSISGYTLNLPSLNKHPKDYYLGKRASSLGWGTWEDRWNKVDWEVKNYNKFKNNLLKQYQFFRIGSDMPKMLNRQMRKKIDSWAIRWCYHQFQCNLLTVFPRISKLEHIGYGEEATNAKKTTRFHTPLDDGKQKKFEFDQELILDNELIKEFRDKFSLINRFVDKYFR